MDVPFFFTFHEWNSSLVETKNVWHEYDSFIIEKNV